MTMASARHKQFLLTKHNEILSIDASVFADKTRWNDRHGGSRVTMQQVTRQVDPGLALTDSLPLSIVGVAGQVCAEL